MSVQISRILHAGFIFKYGDVQIAFDPIFENPFSFNCYAYPNVEFIEQEIRNLKFDAIFISHYHDDHCSFESLNLLDRKTPIYIYCFYDELVLMIQELGFLFVQQVQINKSIMIKGFEVIPRRALDSDVDSIFQIKVANLNILNVVDSWIDLETLTKLAEYSPWDLILWPFQIMREIEVLAPSRCVSNQIDFPQEWLEQLQILNPRYIVPSSCQFIQESWSWHRLAFFPISYSYFQKIIESNLPNTTVVRMNPSATVMLNEIGIKIATSLDWIKPIGDQNVDYEYQNDFKIPTTSEISKNFTALTEEQTKFVFNFCNVGLLKKYESMSQDEVSYFKKKRDWRLTVYDHHGESKHFYYQLNNSKIELIEKNKKSLSWTTEISMSKLYSSLKFGESLSSLYIRINDIVFCNEIENEIQNADVIEDPLIRCLFNGAFGSYQKNQLKKIKEYED